MEDNDVPIFIKLEAYKDIINIVAVIKKKLVESKNTLGRIKQLRSEEDTEIENWENNLDDVHKKIGFIDELLTEPKF